MKHYKLLLLFGCLALLSNGCAPMNDAINPYNETFKCRTVEDTGECIDTPTAYKKARYPDLETEGYIEDNPGGLTAQEQRYKTLTRLLEKPKKPLLQPPKILRVLLLPYKGENEELFMTRYVYVKIEDSRWILTDLEEK